MRFTFLCATLQLALGAAGPVKHNETLKNDVDNTTRYHDDSALAATFRHVQSSAFNTRRHVGCIGCLAGHPNGCSYTSRPTDLFSRC